MKQELLDYFRSEIYETEFEEENNYIVEYEKDGYLLAITTDTEHWCSKKTNHITWEDGTGTDEDYDCEKETYQRTMTNIELWKDNDLVELKDTEKSYFKKLVEDTYTK